MINSYMVEKTLGKGTYATVYLCTETNTNVQYAMKKMNKKDLKRKKVYDCLKEELKVLSTLEHPNVIWLEEIIDDPNKDNICLVTEYHSKGSLGDKMRAINDKLKQYCYNENVPYQAIGLKLKDARTYFIEMLKALYYCHKIVKVIHRDIKPDNIMINHNNEAVLIDFGVSALIDQQDDDLIDKNMGTYIFFAPEMFQRYKSKVNHVRGEKIDIWALGVTLYYIVNGSYPFESNNVVEIQDKVLNEDIDFSPF